MNNNSIKVFSLFRESWKDYKSNMEKFFVIGIIFLCISLLYLLFFNFFSETGAEITSLLIFLLFSLIRVFLSLGLIRFILKIVDGKTNQASSMDIFRGTNSFSHFLIFFVAGFIYEMFIFLGFIVLIIPGFILAVGFLFAEYFIAEKKASLFESFQKSWEITKGSRLKIFYICFLLALINFGGFLPLGLGLIFTIPFSLLVRARLYRTLSSKS